MREIGREIKREVERGKLVLGTGKAVLERARR